MTMGGTDCSVLGDELIYPRDVRLNFRIHVFSLTGYRFIDRQIDR